MCEQDKCDCAAKKNRQAALNKLFFLMKGGYLEEFKHQTYLSYFALFFCFLHFSMLASDAKAGLKRGRH